MRVYFYKMMKKAFLLISLFIIPLSAQVSAPFVVDFQKHAVGSYTTAMAQQDFPPPTSGSYWYYGMDQGRSEIVDEGGNRVLRVKYPAGCVGPNDSPVGCAIQVKWPLPETADTMWVTYRLKFETGFEFVKGGKLPGLCGGSCKTGGDPPTVGDGWSARIMWRTGGSVVQYMYFVDQTAQYGDDMKWDLTGTQKVFVPDSWDTVTTQIILNTIPSGTSQGEKNGIIRSWFNRELSMDVDTLRLVDFDDQKIDLFYISTFHGGADASWAPTTDSYIRYDDFRISVTPPDFLLPEEPHKMAPPLLWETNPRLSLNNNTLHFSRSFNENISIKITDLKGKDVWNGTLPAGETQISISSLPAGIYSYFLTGKQMKYSAMMKQTAD